METGLGRGGTALDGTQLIDGKEDSSPHFRNLRTQACLRPYKPRPMSIVAKCSPISVTAELLFLIFRENFPNLGGFK